MYLAEVNEVHDFDSKNLLTNNLAIFEIMTSKICLYFCYTSYQIIQVVLTLCSFSLYIFYTFKERFIKTIKKITCDSLTLCVSELCN